MVNTEDLMGALAPKIAWDKTASALTLEDVAASNPVLQDIVGDADDRAAFTFTQFKPNPGVLKEPDPNSPIEGDDNFFFGLLPGARFQDKNGDYWEISGIDWSGGPTSVEIFKVWYPRINATVSVYDIRRSIFAWTEPFFQIVGEPPAGVDYEATPVRIVK